MQERLLKGRDRYLQMNISIEVSGVLPSVLMDAQQCTMHDLHGTSTLWYLVNHSDGGQGTDSAVDDNVCMLSAQCDAALACVSGTVRQCCSKQLHDMI